MARISRSHRGGRGSIPRFGTFSWADLKKFFYCNSGMFCLIFGIQGLNINFKDAGLTIQVQGREIVSNS